MTTRRGTSNTNARGNSRDRSARRAYLLRVYEADAGPGTARCYRCGDIRPACGGCNSETGGRTRGSR